uniref:Uncharacterized protein n=1 Tax=Spironucleus salmonicida TaxID=348837 RepID=V6LMI6_9EUKA|eukprot:EST44921.1 Hypothetical protein SS50377_14940 [Spironucleus salmonicida]
MMLQLSLSHILIQDYVFRNQIGNQWSHWHVSKVLFHWTLHMLRQDKDIVNHQWRTKCIKKRMNSQQNQMIPKMKKTWLLCRQKLGATKVQILEGSTSSDDEVDVQINKNIDVPRKININLKKQELMTVTDASLLNQEILGSVNGKLVYRDDVILHEKASALDFFSRFRDFVQEPNILLKFLDQFHTVQLQKYFENIQRQVTPKDLTQLLLACKYGQKIMTISKMINMLYNISDIDGVNKMVRLLPSDEMIIIEEIIRFFNTWIEIECTDDKKGLYKERVLCIAESWLNE